MPKAGLPADQTSLPDGRRRWPSSSPKGYTDRRIADGLTITEGTAGVHVHRILEKLGLRSRVQVVDWALAHGLIDS